MVKYIVFFLGFVMNVNMIFAEESSVISKLINGDKYGVSVFGLNAGIKTKFPDRSDVTSNTESKMTFINSSQDVTLADFSMGMNCKTGAINISGSLPDLTSFSSAMKVFAPFAVNDKGEVDFKNLLSSLMQEYAMEKLTEETLNYLAYIHYYLTGTMSDNPPGDLMMFKSKEYKACLEQTYLSAMEETLSLGIGINNIDDMEALVGLDVTQLIKKAYCSFKFTGVDVGVEERERFNKSKALIRAIFYKLLNGSFDFSLSQSEKCNQWDSLLKGANEFADAVLREGAQRCVNGDSHNSDGSMTSCVSNTKSVTDPADDAGTDGSLDPRSATSKDEMAETKIVSDKDLTEVANDSSGDTAILTTGSQKTTTRYDFASKVIFTPSSLFMDKVDLSIDERYGLFDTTLSSFKAAIVDSALYINMSTPSREASIEVIERILTLQQLNHKNLKKLECAVNKNACEGYGYITSPEYNRVVKNDGRVSTCVSKTIIAGKEVCSKTRAIDETMYDGFESSVSVGIEKRREYMNKLVSDTMFYYIYNYLQTHYGLVFKEDFNYLGNDSAGNPQGARNIDYIRIKLSSLRQASKLSRYWTSPISSSAQNDSLRQDLIDLETLSKSGEPLDRSNFVKVVQRIMKNTANNVGEEALSMSFAPYIYEPINELQLAKVLYYLSDSLNLRKVSMDASLTELSVSIPGFYDYTRQVEPIINTLASLKVVDSPNYTTAGAISPFKPININNVLINQFLYQKILSSKHLLTVEEFENVVKMVDSFKDFYIKRLLDAYKDKFSNVSGGVINVLRTVNSVNETKITDLEYEVKKLSFRMFQRREMLKLLINE